jgi:hypothetical protein
MRFIANDVRTRAALTRLLVKIENDPEAGSRIGLEDTSRFRSEAVINEKEVKENAQPDICHSDYGRSF